MQWFYTGASPSSLSTGTAPFPSTQEHQAKWAIFIPILIGLSIATQVTRIGIRTAGFVKQNQIITANQHVSVDLSDHIQRLLKTLSLIQLVHEFLAQRVMDNRLVIVYLLAREGRVYAS